MPNFKTPPKTHAQRELFPSNVYDLLRADHECYLYHDLFEQIDTREIEKQYHHLGQHAYHPRQIVSILIYAYSRGIFSSREIQRRSEEDLSFMYIAQKHCPNFRVLSDFRKNHADFFKQCFIQTVHLAKELKMASFGHISLDGSKFKANSSKHKAMSYKRLKEQEAKLTEEIEALIKTADQCDLQENAEYQDKTGYEINEDLKFKQQRLEKIGQAKKDLEKREQAINPGKTIDDKKQISFADKEARIMGKKGDFDYQYNAQISVDSDYQMIVGQHVSQNANDKKELEPALHEIKGSGDDFPAILSADNGYLSASNLEATEAINNELEDDQKVDIYIATDRTEKQSKTELDQSQRKLVKADFEYRKDQDCFVCPNGKELILKSQNSKGERVYKADENDCNGCEYQSRCCKSQQGNPRSITTDDKEAIRQAMNRKMELEPSKEIYKLRKVIVEPVFGQLKHNIGFRRFSLRGKAKVAGEFSLLCATYNIKKIVRAISKGLVRPNYRNEDKLAMI